VDTLPANGTLVYQSLHVVLVLLLVTDVIDGAPLSLAEMPDRCRGRYWQGSS